MYLFGASLGNFDQSIFGTMLTIEPEWGEIYMVLFLITQFILLLTLLVAMLSNTYAELQPQSKALQSIEIATMINVKREDERYGSLVSAFPGMDLLLIPFLPYFMLAENPKRLNDILYKVEFTVCQVIAAVLFLLAEALMIPMAYLITLFIKVKRLCSRAKTRKRKQKGLFKKNQAGDIIRFFFMGIPQLFYWSCARLPHLISQLRYQTDLCSKGIIQWRATVL